MTDIDLQRDSLRCSTIIATYRQVLLVHRTDGARDDWVLPGGTPRHGETLISCARREALEETGLRVLPNRIAFVLESVDPVTLRITIDVVFLAGDQVDGEAHEREPGLIPSWVPLSDLATLDLRPPIGGHIRNLLTSPVERTAAYLGNLWRPRRSLTRESADAPWMGATSRWENL